ncbi:MAG: zinc-binding dehydrogenase [Gammaproteobacteria bacterium]|nr:zinc-binding dehydrogenase [Gammaproteobacteria bacterium]
MRAAIMRDSKLFAGDIADPVPGPGEVLVKTLACGICGSDLHALKHTRQFVENAPGGSMSFDMHRDVVMGHEFCAEILDYGLGCTKQHAVGTRVCAVPMLLRDGVPTTVGYSNSVPGGYAERMVLMEALLLPVKNGLSSELAALTEPLAVGLHAVEMARLEAGDIPLVIGCGPIGLAVITALKARDVRPIIAADYSPLRRKLAQTQGADIVIDPAETSPYATWRDLATLSLAGERLPENPLTGTPVLRPGVFFECVGVPGVIDQMMVGAERGCRFVVVGVCMEPDQIRPLLAVTKELNLQFVLAYTPEEFARTLALIGEGAMKVDALITGKVGVEGVADAFRDLGNPEAHAKIVVEPWRAR